MYIVLISKILSGSLTMNTFIFQYFTHHNIYDQRNHHRMERLINYQDKVMKGCVQESAHAHTHTHTHTPVIVLIFHLHVPFVNKANPDFDTFLFCIFPVCNLLLQSTFKLYVFLCTLSMLSCLASSAASCLLPLLTIHNIISQYSYNT